MSCRNWFAAGVVASSLFTVESNAVVLLNIDFENYTPGALNGQSGGTNGGAWTAPAPEKVAVSSPAIGTQAASLSRDSGANSYATIPLASPELDTSSPSIYFSFDFYRAGDDDRGVVTLWNSNSGNNTGLGVSIENGASPLLYLITGGGYASQVSSYAVENSKWHRIEFEANGATDQYDVYVQKEGVAGRLLIGDNIAWSAPNGVVNGFQYLAQGLLESDIVLDNLYLETGASFPVNRPLEVPEPAAVSLLALAAGVTLRRSRSR